MSDDKIKTEMVYSESAVMRAALQVIKNTYDDSIQPDSVKRHKREAVYEVLKELGVGSFKRTNA